MKRRGLSFVIPALVLLSACGGGGDDVEASGDVVNSPIAEYLGYDAANLDDPEAQQAQFNEEERARQEAVAACMKSEGFDYIPVDPGQYTIFGTGAEEYGSDEWVAKYGFGVTTQYWPQSALGDGLVGYDDAAVSDFQDPNMEIVSAMSPEEQEAYNTALYGDQTFEFDETLSEEEQEEAMNNQTFTMGGCYGQAQEETGDVANQFYNEFNEELTELYERVQNDPRIVAYEKKVVDCVAEQGLEYPGQDEIYNLWQDELSEIESQVDQPGADITEEEMAAMTEAELTELFNTPPVIPEAAQAKLAEIQAEEIALAQAVNECDGGMEEQQKLYMEVSAEYEQQFLEDNADRLEELKAA